MKHERWRIRGGPYLQEDKFGPAWEPPGDPLELLVSTRFRHSFHFSYFPNEPLLAWFLHDILPSVHLDKSILG